MNSIRSIMLDARKKLQHLDAQSFSLDAQIIMSHAIDKSVDFIILNPYYICSVAETEVFYEYIDRRHLGEPVAYIVKSKNFWNHEFYVDSNVLIPRPESELIIERIIGIFPHKAIELGVLDLGTGSGCLLLSILKEYPNAFGIGADISEDALNIAKKNAIALGVLERAKLVHSNWAFDIKDSILGAIDIIVTNPPYVEKKDISGGLIYEPSLALLGDDQDALGCYRQIKKSLQNRALKKKVFLLIEHGFDQLSGIREVFDDFGEEIFAAKDLSGHDRITGFIIK